MAIRSDRDGSAPRVLVVDDDEGVAESIEAFLRRAYHVSTVYSGITAIQAARRHRPDLIIMDVVMPGLTGIETCKQFRVDSDLADIPILFLSALSTPQEKIEGLKAGADDYLAKPYHLEELQLRVEAILRRTLGNNRPKSTERYIKVGDLELDKQNYEVCTGKKQAILTPVEFELLHHLMMHPDEVLNSEKLLQEVWDYPSEAGSPDLVRMHIKKIRQKIEVDPQNPEFIVTIRRRGYTIAVD